DLLALAHVDLRVRAGESVGIIGRNGAGKTTLMKVIARVLRPKEGQVTIRRRVAPLLELGAGFDMELSGRENIFLNGAILGRSRTLVLVSHSPQAILQLCEHAVWLDQGRVVANGPAPQVVDAFVSRFTPRAVAAAG